MPHQENTTQTPEYLYHYTNVDALALILKNKTIRLNALNKMDDRQEQMSKDKQNFGKFVFVSSWTDDENESIPMWRMYTPKQRGVRIKLLTNPFVEYPIDVYKLSEMTNLPVAEGTHHNIAIKTIVPINIVLNNYYSIANYQPGNQLVHIIYTCDEQLLSPTILNVDKDFNLNLGKMGLYKNIYWQFQNEWRYRLLALPISFNKLISKSMNNNQDELNKEIAVFQRYVITGSASIPIDYIDLAINDVAFSKMEIMLAPDISESSEIFVNLLVDKYNPECKIIKSKLTDLVQ